MAEQSITEGELERLRGLSKQDLSDPFAAQVWARAIQADLGRLLELCEEVQKIQGNDFARKIRAALEGRIVRELNGRCGLTDDVVAESVSVHTGQNVWVDIRLRIGRWNG